MKTCCACLKSLPTDKFATRYRRGKIEYQSRCKSCQSTYRKNHYEKHKDKYVLKAAQWRQKERGFIQDLKSELGCRYCGENHPACLDFHHRDSSEKSYTIGKKAGAVSRKSIEFELSKCDVVCANCHRKLHWKEE
jgi:hypothetical protein